MGGGGFCKTVGQKPEKKKLFSVKVLFPTWMIHVILLKDILPQFDFFDLWELIKWSKCFLVTSIIPLEASSEDLKLPAGENSGVQIGVAQNLSLLSNII